MAKWVELPVSKSLIDLDNIWWITGSNINEYHAFPKTASPALPKFDSEDRDFLMKQLGIEPSPAEPLVKA